MRLCEHPELLAFCEALRENPGIQAGIAGCTDWFTDHDAKLADVLEAYALPPLSPEIRPDQQCSDDTLRPVLATWLEMNIDQRWEILDRCRITEVFFNGRSCWNCTTNLEGSHRLTASEGRLALKRKMLRLFPEVRYERRCELSQYAYPKPPTFAVDPVLRPFFEGNGFLLGNRPLERFIVRTEDRENRRWVYLQTLTPEQLLPPEPEVSSRARMDDFARGPYMTGPACGYFGGVDLG